MGANHKGVLKINGGQICDYVYFTSNSLTSAQSAANRELGNCYPWTFNTQFRIDFTKLLVAGNASTGDEPPDSWDIYREVDGSGNLVFAGTSSGDNLTFVDYAIGNQRSIRYYIYPSSGDYLGAPIVTDWITTNFPGWSLIVCESTDTDNVYTVDSIYHFDLNLASTQINNNTQSSIMHNFTNYLRVQTNNTNCWSGHLSALLGKYDFTANGGAGEYYEDLDMIREYKRLTTDRRDMFLRDYDGNLLKVRITSPITIAQNINSSRAEHTKAISWVEVGSSEGVQITG